MRGACPATPTMVGEGTIETYLNFPHFKARPSHSQHAYTFVFWGIWKSSLRFRGEQRQSDICEVCVRSDIETVDKAGDSGKRLP